MKKFRLPWNWHVDDQTSSSSSGKMKHSGSASEALIIDGVEEEEGGGGALSGAEKATKNGGGIFGVKSYFKYLRLSPDADVSMTAPVSVGSSPTGGAGGGTVWYLLPPTRSQRARFIDALARFCTVIGVLLVLFGAGAILVGYGWPPAAAMIRRHRTNNVVSAPAAAKSMPQSGASRSAVVVASDGMEVYGVGMKASFGNLPPENAFDSMGGVDDDAIAAAVAPSGVQIQQERSAQVANDDYWPIGENGDGLMRIAIEQDENGNFFYIAPERFASQLLRADPWHHWKMAGFCALAVGASMVALSVLAATLLGGGNENGGYLTAATSGEGGAEPPIRIYASASPISTGQVAQQPPKAFANVGPTRRAPTNRISPTSGGPVPVFEEVAKVQPNSGAKKCRSPSSAATSPIGGGPLSASSSNGSLADRLLLSENNGNGVGGDARPLLAMKH